jgi:SAM-dependent methyltransferase
LSTSDAVFAGSVPQLYDTYLVPLIFEPYAIDVVDRLKPFAPSRILELACGSGVVTRALSAALGDKAEIVATDFNQPMLDRAASVGTQAKVDWRKADAMSIPFEDESFDAVVCQFGVMFFPDKPKAFAEAKRVLKGGGVYICSAWDKIEENEFANVVTIALESLFPNDPPRFLARTPHGYNDPAIMEKELKLGGFKSFDIETIAQRSRADSPTVPALGYVQGTPLRDEITARDPSRIADATRIATKRIESEFGDGAVDAKIQAHVIVAHKE